MTTAWDPIAFRQELLDAASESSVLLDESQVHLATSHAVLLLRWNPVAGLTTITEPSLVARRHFVESFLAARLLPPARAGATLRLLDVGSGGGFPGLAMKIVRPDLEPTLLEPRLKKAAYLREVARQYPSPAVRVLPVRLDEVPLRTPWPVITMRAVVVAPRELVRAIVPSGLIINLAGPQSMLTSIFEAAHFKLAGVQAIPGRDTTITAWRPS